VLIIPDQNIRDRSQIVKGGGLLFQGRGPENINILLEEGPEKFTYHMKRVLKIYIKCRLKIECSTIRKFTLSWQFNTLEPDCSHLFCTVIQSDR
jgi:hypothetical protein